MAEALAAHPAVAKVNYPGLPGHPQHGLARRQQKGFGAMLSFELKDGSQAAVERLLLGLRWFTLAESLGGVESLVAHPASMTHASMTPEARRSGHRRRTDPAVGRHRGRGRPDRGPAPGPAGRMTSEGR